MVRAHIDNTELKLRPGMLMTVRLVTTQREALMVPEDALVQRGNQAFVYTVEEDKARMTTVEQGERYAGWIEVKQGLALGDPVIVEGVIKVRDGSPVIPTGTTAKRPEQPEPDDGRQAQPPPPA
jgi:membrane fusion protein (multidrug efflux system)